MYELYLRGGLSLAGDVLLLLRLGDRRRHVPIKGGLHLLGSLGLNGLTTSVVRLIALELASGILLVLHLLGAEELGLSGESVGVELARGRVKPTISGLLVVGHFAKNCFV